MSKLGRRILAGTALAAVLAGPAFAQGYPAKPLRFVLPFPAGGPTDILGRLLGQRLGDALGQAVVPENRPGAGGNVGAEFAAKQPPDGYTIVLCASSLAISPNLYRKLNYDPVRDFAPISLVAQIPNVLLVHPSVPAKSLKELAALARANPGKLTFGSGGLGTSNHLGSEMFKTLAGVNMLHVPYKGSNMAMLGMIGGHVDMVVIGVPPAIPQIQARKVRALAVLSAQRLPALPEVPTTREAGFPGYEVTTWYGILAPAGTAREIVARLNSELVKIVSHSDTRERYAAAGFDPLTSTPEQFAEFIKTETVRWARVIREANLRIEN
ncbi:MAG TPA: tripartite tricarboxylate transporter substrate binding protein [Burkholderiales bacterium]|nr:tripartite tricarboxylate transporter substrate binding protein [Burkholderiales bacterium]